jgi:putative addiction module killer protein
VEARPQEINFLEAGGVEAWLDELELSDEAAYDAIVARLERVEDGNFGDYGRAGNVLELRFRMAGPGYRIYFGRHDDIVVLLRAGVKKTQDADIAVANELWKEYNDAYKNEKL